MSINSVICNPLELIHTVTITKSDINKGLICLPKNHVFVLPEEDGEERVFISYIKVPFLQRFRFVNRPGYLVCCNEKKVTLFHTFNLNGRQIAFEAEYEFAITPSNVRLFFEHGKPTVKEMEPLLRLDRGYQKLLSETEDPFDTLKHRAFKKVVCPAFNRFGFHIRDFYVKNFTCCEKEKKNMLNAPATPVVQNNDRRIGPYGRPAPSSSAGIAFNRPNHY